MDGSVAREGPVSCPPAGRVAHYSQARRRIQEDLLGADGGMFLGGRRDGRAENQINDTPKGTTTTVNRVAPLSCLRLDPQFVSSKQPFAGWRAEKMVEDRSPA